MRKIKKAFKKRISITRGVNVKDINIKSVRRFKSPITKTTRYMFQFIFINNNAERVQSIGAYPPLPKNLTF